MHIYKVDGNDGGVEVVSHLLTSMVNIGTKVNLLRYESSLLVSRCQLHGHLSF